VPIEIIDSKLGEPTRTLPEQRFHPEVQRFWQSIQSAPSKFIGFPIKYRRELTVDDRKEVGIFEGARAEWTKRFQMDWATIASLLEQFAPRRIGRLLVRVMCSTDIPPRPGLLHECRALDEQDATAPARHRNATSRLLTEEPR
jgi:hypothetical protein